jgi:hypothetical protein
MIVLLTTIPVKNKKTMIIQKINVLRSFKKTHHRRMANILPHVPGAKGKYPTLKQLAIHSDILNLNRKQAQEINCLITLRFV